MPYMNVSVAKKLTKEKQDELVKELGETMNLLPGKFPGALIVDLEDDKQMFVGGVRQDDFVFADIRYFSNFKYQIKRDFTVAVFKAITKAIGTPEDKMHLNINEYNNWGGFGNYMDEFYSEESK